MTWYGSLTVGKARENLTGRGKRLAQYIHMMWMLEVGAKLNTVTKFDACLKFRLAIIADRVFCYYFMYDCAAS